MSRFFLKDSATVYRLTSSGDKESYSSVGTVTCHLQPLDAETAVLSGSVVGQSFRLFTETGVDLVVTDKITVSDETYIVKAAQTFNFGTFPHIVWTLEKPAEN